MTPRMNEWMVLPGMGVSVFFCYNVHTNLRYATKHGYGHIFMHSWAQCTCNKSDRITCWITPVKSLNHEIKGHSDLIMIDLQCTCLSMLFDMTVAESILMRIGSNFTTSLQALLAIGTNIVHCYLWCRWETLLPMLSFFLHLMLLPLVYSNLWCCNSES